MDPDALLELFVRAADAARDALAPLHGADRRRRTERPGQYDLDLVADAAILDVLRPTGLAVVSEESGRSGPSESPVTVVVDPVDGSTNCSRDIPYWSVSLCAMDDDGPSVSLVRNQATGVTTTAVRGHGARRDGEPLTASPVRALGDAVVCFVGTPRRILPWAQSRSLGSAALELCDVAAGALDGFVTAGAWLAPWDYLGGLLACVEATGIVVDAGGNSLGTTDPSARRQVLAAGTPELLAELRTAVEP